MAWELRFGSEEDSPDELAEPNKLPISMSSFLSTSLICRGVRGGGGKGAPPSAKCAQSQRPSCQFSDRSTVPKVYLSHRGKSAGYASQRLGPFHQMEATKQCAIGLKGQRDGTGVGPTPKLFGGKKPSIQCVPCTNAKGNS